ncbi:MAG TPA: RNA-binding S4 domain-containing protein [Clostridiaceae bacterium]|mgnify:FL=1|nr:RNA-binding S4 domain-containing protein [Clostridiaceae bacterium]
MRIDKFLKVSRIIKRRTLANEACAKERVTINGRIAKPGSEVKVGDIVEIRFGEKLTRLKVLKVTEHAKKEDSIEMYELI